MFKRVTVKQLNSHVWLLDDAHESTGYLVAGQDRALVIDTMNGHDDVKAIAETLTDKPLMVINTHGHCDHIYGNVWFDSVMIHEDDIPIARAQCEDPHFVKALEENGLRMPPFETVKNGDIIDLGGLSVEVIALPGHTPGGICLLLKEDRILFTGDSINRHLWMQLEESLSLPETLANLDKIAFVKDRADRILHGHAQDFEDISLYDQLREGLRQLCEQEGTEVTDQDKEYDWFGGKDLQHEFAKDSVIVYTRGKLPRVDMKPEFEVIDSYCGIDCSTCEFLTGGKCAGCIATKGRPFHMKNEETCILAACCQKKGLRYCADCAEVPCENLTQFSNDPVYGDKPAGARIARLGELKKDLLKKARQGQKKITVCGFCCGENCFLGEWCGWCGSEYNCCSYATLMPDGICPNLRCVREKGLNGCWECPELMKCKTGFYGITEDPGAVNLAKAGALFIRKFGADAFSYFLHYILTEKKTRYNDYFTDKSSAEKLFEDMSREFSK